MPTSFLDLFLPNECLIDAPYQMPGIDVNQKAEKWIECAWKRGWYAIIIAIIIITIVIIILLAIKNSRPDKLGWRGILGITTAIVLLATLSIGWPIMKSTIEAREMVSEYKARKIITPNYTWEDFIREQQKEKELDIQIRQAEALERRAPKISSASNNPFSRAIGTQLGNQFTNFFGEKK